MDAWRDPFVWALAGLMALPLTIHANILYEDALKAIKNRRKRVK